MLVDNDLFLSKLTLMFDKSRSKGHVDLCMKRYDGRTKPIPKPRKNVKQKGKKLFLSKLPPAAEPHPEPAEYMCLIRAVLGKEKISTVINAKDVNKFQVN
ncbi:signal recognition particle 14 kDa protein-like [Eurytemora carolleeae]|uniref:signal recognition particle 14 kDa protein-like n=1 Tax=Eurytemora carolleeae TaxID=1294199 RepID=UPI000C7924C0|nr:signal recognition particle 14 kDa protein-like [Eurytemora carolleeae]|eukprot:XP_023324668.1 signal recognition particle 14 kDa protein-like [Eurytemora affinis]